MFESELGSLTFVTFWKWPMKFTYKKDASILNKWPSNLGWRHNFTFLWQPAYTKIQSNVSIEEELLKTPYFGNPKNWKCQKDSFEEKWNWTSWTSIFELLLRCVIISEVNWCKFWEFPCVKYDGDPQCL